MLELLSEYKYELNIQGMQEKRPVPEAWLEMLRLTETLKADGEESSQDLVKFMSLQV